MSLGDGLKRCLFEKDRITALSMLSVFEVERIVKQVKEKPNQPWETHFEFAFTNLEHEWYKRIEQAKNSVAAINGTIEPDKMVIKLHVWEESVTVGFATEKALRQHLAEHMETHRRVEKEYPFLGEINPETDTFNYTPVVREHLYQVDNGKWFIGFVSALPKR